MGKEGGREGGREGVGGEVRGGGGEVGVWGMWLMLFWGWGWVAVDAGRDVGRRGAGGTGCIVRVRNGEGYFDGKRCLPAA